MKQRWVTHLLVSIGLFAACTAGCSPKPIQNAPIDPANGKEVYSEDPNLQGKGPPVPAAPKMPAWLKDKGTKK
jgi:hypothetical protein